MVGLGELILAGTPESTHSYGVVAEVAKCASFPRAINEPAMPKRFVSAVTKIILVTLFRNKPLIV